MKNAILTFLLVLSVGHMSSSLFGQGRVSLYDDEIIFIGREIAGFLQVIENGRGHKMVLITLDYSVSAADRDRVRNYIIDDYAAPLGVYKVKVTIKSIWELGQESEKLYGIKEKFKKQVEQNTNAFLDYVYARFARGLESEEGVYRSIDQNELYEYDILVLKDIKSSNYLVYLINSTDPELHLGDILIVLKTTAVANTFFMEYRIKSGRVFSNKVATIDGGVLKSGIKSFLKIYPQGTTLTPNNYIPSVNWKASGSGYILNSDGYIATNYHVVEGFRDLTVKVYDSTYNYIEKQATLLDFDSISDIAILKIDTIGLDLPKYTFNVAQQIEMGQEVFSLGFPAAHKFGEWAKLNKGIISSPFGYQGNDLFFQTDLPLWYGNSGGPCFDSRGRLLGLATMIAFDRGTKMENVAYVSKASNIARLLEGLKVKSQNEPSQLESLKFKELLPRAVFIACQ